MKSFIGNIGSVERYANSIALAVALAGAETLTHARRDMARVNGQQGLASVESVENFIGESVQDAGFALLESIKSEPAYLNHPEIVAVRKEEQRIRREQAEKVQDEGLTTEINTCRSAVSIHDTLENCTAILQRHPFGYNEKFTAEENAEAAQWEQAVVATKAPRLRKAA